MFVARRPVPSPTPTPGPGPRSRRARRRRPSRANLLCATLAGALAGAVGGAGLGTLAPTIDASLALDPLQADPAHRIHALAVAARPAPVATVLLPARGVDASPASEPEERRP